MSRTIKFLLPIMIMAAARASLAQAGVFALTPAATDASARPAFVVAATDQIERGGATFRAICAKCHGEQGQGGEGPRLIGSPNGLKGYLTAKGLFDFASKEMPFDTPASLKPEEYWDILAFILDANKLLPPDTILGPENAANTRLSD